MKPSIKIAALAALIPGAIFAAAFRPAIPMGDPATIDRIVKEGKDHSQVMRYLTHLSKRIGPRLTGSPQLAQAEQWTMAEFRRMGLTNVHLEKWGEVPVGFSRGKVQVARMVAPFSSDMVFTTAAWTNGTNGIVRGKVVKLPATVAEVDLTQLKGAWVLLPPPAPRAPRPPAGATPAGTPPAQRPTPPPAPNAEVIEAVEKAGIAGFITGSRSELVLTGGSWRGKTLESHPGAPRVTVRKSDYDRLTRNLSFGREVVVEIGAENRWHKGPFVQSNVVAEIKGTEKPDEVIIVSGHLDTWNGPGSEGALDNGTGISTAMEAARILMRTGAKPKRTIRFVLWTGEEQGLLGSSEYVKQHEAEMPKISAVLVDDGGTNYHGGYDCIASQKEWLETAMAPTQAAFPNLPMKLNVLPRMPRGGGSDHVPFNRVGVPGFFTEETGRSDYDYVHHTQHDKLEMAIPEYLVQSATNHAVVAYNLACAPDLLPREPRS
ncbi:MAG: M20/M25/M40 family metallo-hydrolase [Fimbriimonas sp.]